MYNGHRAIYARQLCEVHLARIQCIFSRSCLNHHFLQMFSNFIITVFLSAFFVYISVSFIKPNAFNIRCPGFTSFRNTAHTYPNAIRGFCCSDQGFAPPAFLHLSLSSSSKSSSVSSIFDFMADQYHVAILIASTFAIRQSADYSNYFPCVGCWSKIDSWNQTFRFTRSLTNTWLGAVGTGPLAALNGTRIICGGSLNTSARKPIVLLLK